MIKIKLPLSFVLLTVVSLSACTSGSGSSPTSVQTAVFEGFHLPVDKNEVSTDLQNQPQLDQPLNLTGTNGSIEYLRIKHHMAECEGYQVSLCMLIQEDGSDDWVFFYDQIEGFDYQWGHDYEVLVLVEAVDAGPAHVGQQRYTLVEIISDVVHATDNAFEYTSRKLQERVVEVEPGHFSLLGNKKFICTDENCNTLRSSIAQNHSALLSFEHNANTSEPLVLNAVLCSDAASSFAESCL